MGLFREIPVQDAPPDEEDVGARGETEIAGSNKLIDAQPRDAINHLKTGVATWTDQWRMRWIACFS
jgi:hypothetical protein